MRDPESIADIIPPLVAARFVIRYNLKNIDTEHLTNLLHIKPTRIWRPKSATIPYSVFDEDDRRWEYYFEEEKTRNINTALLPLVEEIYSHRDVIVKVTTEYKLKAYFDIDITLDYTDEDEAIMYKIPSMSLKHSTIKCISELNADYNIDVI